MTPSTEFPGFSENQDIHQSEAKFQWFFKRAPLPLAHLARDGKILELNDRFVQTFGYTVQDMPTMDRCWELIFPDLDYREMVKSSWEMESREQLADGSDVGPREFRITCKSGSVRIMLVTANLIQDSILVSFFDITERKQAELSQFESMELLRTTLNATADGILVVNKEGRITQANRRFFQMWHIPPELQSVNDDGQMLAFAIEQLEEPERFLDRVRELYQSRIEDRAEIHFKDGRIFERHSSPMIHAGKEFGRVWDFRDITERKRTEEAIDFERRQLLSIFDSLNEIIYVSDPFTYEILFANKYLRDMIGRDMVGKRCYKALQGKDHPCEFCTNPIILHNDRKPHRWEFHNPLLKTDFAIIDQMIRWPDGRDVRFEFAQDITQRNQAEKEREKLQQQLFQSQKLEAVGVLAGGVAHDFNNMLGVIIGYAELTIGKMDAGHPLRENLAKILDAAQRSAGLTRQLLAFARKQTVAPKVLDLNESIEAILKMLRRIIGENIGLVWLPGTGPCTVKMDPSQIDQILANLCVNSRHAITDVGKITIETDTIFFDQAYCNAHIGFAPGKYVLLAVSDTGYGMDQQTIEHIFEPFFTTKGLGKGTGLGLATVYGIVKQNEGFINVFSEQGKGTTIKIYLPSFEFGEAEERMAEIEAVPHGRGETILLIEDDPAVLKMGETMLRDLGYTVLSADTPKEAIRHAEEHTSDIHIFITDVIMPDMNGRDLADRLLAIRPKMKHLFMSGYTADIITQQGILDKNIHFLGKPFNLKELAVKVREVLD